MLIHVVVRIQFLMAIGLSSLLPCWLSPEGYSQLLDATHIPQLVAPSSIFKAGNDGLSPLMPQVSLASAPWHVPDTLSLTPAGKDSLLKGLCDSGSSTPIIQIISSPQRVCPSSYLQSPFARECSVFEGSRDQDVGIFGGP